MSGKEFENWVTMKDVQAHLGVRRETITKWISSHNLPAYKVGRVWKFKLSEVDEWVKNGGVSQTQPTSPDTDSEEV